MCLTIMHLLIQRNAKMHGHTMPIKNHYITQCMPNCTFSLRQSRTNVHKCKLEKDVSMHVLSCESMKEIKLWLKFPVSKEMMNQKRIFLWYSLISYIWCSRTLHGSMEMMKYIWGRLKNEVCREFTNADLIIVFSLGEKCRSNRNIEIAKEL
mgnify:CR=1 FL=1